MTSTRRNLPLFLPVLLVLGTLLSSGPATAAPKTDIITLHNGDVITCEIKELSHGKLRVKTDDMGMLSIEWDKIARVVSRYLFLVKLDDGSLLYGQIPDSGEDGILRVAFQYEDDSGNRVPIVRVASLEAIRYDVWDRIDLAVSAGYNWTKASETSQANVSAQADYKGRIYRYGFNTDTIVTTERDNTTTRRQELELYGSRIISGRLHTGLTGGFQRNDQLGLALRSSAGLNLGYLLLMERHLELSVQGGLAATREWSSRDEPHQDAAEAVVSAQFTFFHFDSPKTDLTVRADVFPSLTVSDRVRFEFNTSLRHEVVSDLFVDLTYYESRDNRPPDGAADTADRGVIFSLGWSK